MSVTLAQLREMIARLPTTFERPCYGTPGFYAGKKFFARVREDGESLVLKVSDLERDALLQLEPAVYSWPVHYLKSDLFVIHLPSAIATDLEPLLVAARGFKEAARGSSGTFHAHDAAKPLTYDAVYDFN